MAWLTGDAWTITPVTNRSVEPGQTTIDLGLRENVTLLSGGLDSLCAAMIADEVSQGLLRLRIVHEKTLPYSPYQNGKQECFWASLEGRLMEMLGAARPIPAVGFTIRLDLAGAGQ